MRPGAAVRVGIAGLAGRVGRLLAEEVGAAGGVLVGGIVREGSTVRPPEGVAVLAGIAAMAGSCDVVIDFSSRAAMRGHVAAVAEAGAAYVVGVTGLDEGDEAALEVAAQRIAVLQAANFSAGVVLALALAERMGAALPAARFDAEILETHHRGKVDAPSGTALALGRAVAVGRGVALENVRAEERSGPRQTGAIGFAVRRGGAVVGEHSLLFASDTEQIELTHRALDRRVFAAGAVQAALWVAGRPAGRYGMRDVLGV